MCVCVCGGLDIPDTNVIVEQETSDGATYPGTSGTSPEGSPGSYKRQATARQGGNSDPPPNSPASHH